MNLQRFNYHSNGFLEGLLGFPRMLMGAPTLLDANERQYDLMQPYTSILSADLVEGDDKYFVSIDLPGVEDVNVEVKNGMLSITAERQIVREDDKKVR